MKHLILFIAAAISLSFLASCEQNPNEEENEINLNYAQKLIRKYDKMIPQLLKNDSREETRASVYQMYSELKKNRNFVGMSIRNRAGSYSTLNAYYCSFRGEKHALLEDKKREKTIWYGEFFYGDPQFNGDSLIPVNLAAAGTGSEAYYSKTIPNILVITYGEVVYQARFYFKAKAIISEKQAEGSRGWSGTGLMNPEFLDR